MISYILRCLHKATQRYLCILDHQAVVMIHLVHIAPIIFVLGPILFKMNWFSFARKIYFFNIWKKPRFYVNNYYQHLNIHFLLQLLAFINYIQFTVLNLWKCIVSIPIFQDDKLEFIPFPMLFLNQMALYVANFQLYI